MAQKTNVPKKFRDKDFTFFRTLVDEKEKDKTLTPFPSNVEFSRKEQDEEVLLVVRRHWIAYISHVLIALIIPLIPFILLFLPHNDSVGITLYLGLFVTSLVLSTNILVTTFLQWYYNVSIITDKKIVTLTVANVFHHNYTEILWRKVQDISHDSVGALSSIFDLGTIYIDTAGADIDLKLPLVQNPRDVQDVIDNLVELTHNGKL
ncbi:hypothetical protein K8R20_03320 [bacterium]|nr:hypothetical protein [bacterium]